MLRAICDNRYWYIDIYRTCGGLQGGLEKKKSSFIIGTFFEIFYLIAYNCVKVSMLASLLQLCFSASSDGNVIIRGWRVFRDRLYPTVETLRYNTATRTIAGVTAWMWSLLSPCKHHFRRKSADVFCHWRKPIFGDWDLVWLSYHYAWKSVIFCPAE